MTKEKVSKMHRKLKDLITNKKELEKSAYDTYNVCAMIGCLIRAIHDQTSDNIDTEEERFFWQLKGSLQIAYDTLDNATYTFFEVTNKIDSLIPFATSQGEMPDDLGEKK